MKLNILILLLFLVWFQPAGFGQHAEGFVTDDFILVFDTSSVISHVEEDYTGYTKMLYSVNNGVACEGELYMGKRFGDWKFYDLAGILRESSEWMDGLRSGRAEFYNEDGTSRKMVEYKSGKIWNGYNYDRDHIDFDFSEFQNGYGIIKEYSPQGKLEQKTTFRNGLPHGDVLMLTEEGKVMMKGSYNQGLEDGEWDVYDQDGWIANKITYKAGKMLKVSKVRTTAVTD